jgi:glycerophosphoryl diester phosphodiesterase
MAKAPTPFQRVAHRGSPRERVENTLPGFLLALDHGADAVELDVHCTADGVAVVHHDDEFHGHLLAKVDWADVARFDVGGGATIPRLDDVLDAIGARAEVYIELKGVDIEERVIAVARAHGHRYAMHSFDHPAIAQVAALAPDIPRGVLLDRDIAHPLEQLRDAVAMTGARDVWPHWTLVDPALVQAAHELDARVITWTVNASDIARRSLDAGVDGLCTDDVRLLGNL